MEPDTFLEQGARVLAHKLTPLGYEFFVPEPPLRGSGGPFAWAAFERGNRAIKLWARFERLGSVLYSLGDAEFTHQDYMRALGLEKVAQYPGFEDGEQLGGFKRLLHDLEYCGEFLTGDAAAVVEKVRSMPPKKSGFQALNS
jgi:hypothetical protein